MLFILQTTRVHRMSPNGIHAEENDHSADLEADDVRT